jgi:hypothetical protein
MAQLPFQSLVIPDKPNGARICKEPRNRFQAIKAAEANILSPNSILGDCQVSVSIKTIFAISYITLSSYLMYQMDELVLLA